MPTLQHSYHGADRSRSWLKGNLHTHSTRSDGARDPQAVIDDYAGRGYDFLMFSDHDTHAGPEQFAGWNTRGLTLIPGNEITCGGPHMLHVGASRRVEPLEDRQSVLDDVAGAGGFAVVNHPNWFKDFDHCPHDLMRSWNGYLGIEIYNHVINELEGTAYATDHWDRLLSQGRRVWGFANDDSHKAHHVGYAWSMVLADERRAESVVAAMARGSFYASTGVTIGDISVDGMSVTVSSPDAERIAAISDHGCRIKVVDAATLTVEVPDKATYVRFECWGRGEKQAWTQPMFVMR